MYVFSIGFLFVVLVRGGLLFSFLVFGVFFALLSIFSAGFVLFADRAGVWRRVSDAKWGDMISGYGGGVRWDVGIPLRLDLGWSSDLGKPEVYVSIGQAF